MMPFVKFALTAAAGVALVPAATLFAECVAARLRGKRRPTPPLLRRPRVAVLMPAHNEAGVVGATVAALRPQLAADDDLYVIADNCTDATAAEARQAGAHVWERDCPDRRGKGFAISFALEKLDMQPPEIVVLVDADCRLAAGAIDKIVNLAAFSGRPVQARYLLGSADSSALSAISSLAFLVRNLVRPLGLLNMGFPCHLTGSGMAFPWRVLRNAPSLKDNLVEDLVMGLELAIAGTPPLFCPDAEVTSELPANRAAASGQRRRWEHGQLATLLAYVPKLFAAALRQGKVRLLALALDLAVPPLALLIALLSLLWAASAGSYLLNWAPLAPLGLTTAALALVGAGVTLGWQGYGRQIVPGKTLLMAPLYVLWKIPLYAAFFFRRRQQSWVRTERAMPSPPEPT